jgi:hypothetical protein
VLRHQQAQEPSAVARPRRRLSGSRRPAPQDRLADTLRGRCPIQLGAAVRASWSSGFSGTEQFQGLLERLGLAGEGD